VSQAFGDVGVLITIQLSESDFEGDGHRADYLEAQGDRLIRA
jgi:hypothetical protein